MRRLFAVGCSLTAYHWPTWADIVGREFDHFENWGLPGLGNRAILERLTELTTVNDITQNDVVIVQWSEVHRYDIHLPHQQPAAWYMGGSLHSNPGYTSEWISSNWNEFSYALHTCNYVKLGTLLLETLPCKWVMTSMNTFCDFDKFPELTPYRKYFHTDNWLPPVYEYYTNKNPVLPIFYNNATRVKGYKDPHPTPAIHYEYADKFIKDKFNIQLDKDWIDSVEAVLRQVTDYNSMRDAFINKPNWHPDIHWKRGL